MVTEIEAYKQLGYAIILQAVEDYEEALTDEAWRGQERAMKHLWRLVINYGRDRYLKKRKGVIERRPEKHNASALGRIRSAISVIEKSYYAPQIDELEMFFRSQWFQLLSPGVDGETVIRNIREKVEKEREARAK